MKDDSQLQITHAVIFVMWQAPCIQQGPAFYVIWLHFLRRESLLKAAARAQIVTEDEELLERYIKISRKGREY